MISYCYLCWTWICHYNSSTKKIYFLGLYIELSIRIIYMKPLTLWHRGACMCSSTFKCMAIQSVYRLKSYSLFWILEILHKFVLIWWYLSKLKNETSHLQHKFVVYNYFMCYKNSIHYFFTTAVEESIFDTSLSRPALGSNLLPICGTNDQERDTVLRGKLRGMHFVECWA